MSYMVLEKILTMVVMSLLISAFAHFNESIQTAREADQIVSAAANPVAPAKVQKFVKMSFHSNARKPASL